MSIALTSLAGAPGFEPGITGPKPVALPLGYAPMVGTEILPAISEEQDERDERKDRQRNDGECFEDEDEDRNERNEDL
jgi:hypothetical protein